MHWTSIQALFGVTVCCIVLDHSRHVLALDTLHVAVSDFSCQERVFGECFFDLYFTRISISLPYHIKDPKLHTRP